VSAGLTGNDAISTYRSLAVLSSTTGGYLFDGSQPVAFYRSRLDSPDLTWEKTAAYNVAIDWSMFKGRLNITVRSLQIQDNRSAHVAGRSRPDGLHLALDQYRLDVEQGHRAFDREPEHRAAELPLDDDAHDVA